MSKSLKEIEKILLDEVRVRDGKAVYTDEAALSVAEYIRRQCVEFVKFVGTDEVELESIYEIFDSERFNPPPPSS